MLKADFDYDMETDRYTLRVYNQRGILQYTKTFFYLEHLEEYLLQHEREIELVNSVY